jgi:hypothetical protein
MAQAFHKIVLVVQDLKTKDGKDIGIVSGDVHYFKSARDKTSYHSLQNELAENKDEKKEIELREKQAKHKQIASFQMAFDNMTKFLSHEKRPELKILISALAVQAIDLKENEKKTGKE